VVDFFNFRFTTLGSDEWVTFPGKVQVYRKIRQGSRILIRDQAGPEYYEKKVQPKISWHSGAATVHNVTEQKVNVEMYTYIPKRSIFFT
jgi:hypothetical protein